MNLARSIDARARRSALGFAHLRRAASLVALAALSTCASLDNIDVATDGQVTLPAATLLDKLLGSLAFAGFDSVDFSQELGNQGVSKDQVDAVHLKTFTLTLDSPVNGSFDFLDGVTFFAESKGLPKVKIAWLTSVPKGQRTLDLDVEASVDLAPYVVAPSMTIAGQAEGTRPDQETTISAHVVLDVDVHVPGCN
jgi:hypothetical protein